MINVHLYDVIPSKNRGEAAILIGLRQLLDSVLSRYKFTIVSRAQDYNDDCLYYKDIVDEVIEIYGQRGFRYFFDKAKVIFMLYISLLKKRIGMNGKNSSHPLAKTIINSHVILYGHDNIVAHAGFSSAVYLISLYCRLSKKRLIFCMGSIGPFKGKVQIYLAKKCIDNFDLILIRDRPSYDFVKSLKVGMDKVHLSIDPAFLMKPASGAEVQAIYTSMGLEVTGNDVLGISVAAPLARNIFQNMRSWDERIYKFAQQFAYSVEEFLNRFPEKKCLFVPHAFGPSRSQDDRVLIDRIIESISVEVRKRVYFIREELEAQKLKRVIGDLELLVAMRTHAIIAALSMNVPTIALSLKSRNKTNGIVGELYTLPEWIYYCENFDSRKLCDLIARGWHERREIINVIEMRNDEVKKRTIVSADLIANTINIGMKS